MEGYLSHFSAAMLWKIPYVETVIGKEITGIDAADITVTKHNARFRINGKKVRSTEFALPQGAVTIREGRMVASPELLFLELASELSIHRLILLGLQLCSHPPGLSSAAITTKKNLYTFIAKTTGYRGRRKALQAVKYVRNGSASIMESLTYMILGLPLALGGYGLNDAIFNHEISLKGEAKLRLGQDCCFVDLYYKYAKLGVEYESFAYHGSPTEQGKDAVRSAILQRKGVKMMHLNTIQLYDRDACRDFVYNLAARIGRRIQIRTKKFDEMHTRLRELLPNGKPDTGHQNGLL